MDRIRHHSCSQTRKPTQESRTGKEKIKRIAFFNSGQARGRAQKRTGRDAPGQAARHAISATWQPAQLNHNARDALLDLFSCLCCECCTSFCIIVWRLHHGKRPIMSVIGRFLTHCDQWGDGGRAAREGYPPPRGRARQGLSMRATSRNSGEWR